MPSPNPEEMQNLVRMAAAVLKLRVAQETGEPCILDGNEVNGLLWGIKTIAGAAGEGQER